jgi:hypothetical protein
MAQIPIGWYRHAIVVAVLLSLAGQAWAVPPIILREFTFDNDTSRLSITGGFAGIDQSYGIDGTFGLAIGYEELFDPPTTSLVPFVRFAEVDAVLTGPPGLLGGPGWFGGADLDDMLNLTGLEGSFVDGPDRPGLLFTGVDGQGQPMQVRVTVENRQLRLRGGNDAGCCDFFNSQLDAYADIPFMGDVNRDGFIGIDDLNVVLGSFGQIRPPLMGPDTDGDGYVGIADLNAVLREWNSGNLVTSPLTIPEPLTLCMILPAAACWVIGRRR